MRNRLTLAFVVLTTSLLLGAGIVRAYVLHDLIRDQSASHVRQESVLVARLVAEHSDAGTPVDAQFLSGLVGADSRVAFTPRGGATVAAQGSAYDGGAGASGITARSTGPDGTVTVSQSAHVVEDIFGRDLWSVVVLFLLIAVVAGVMGYLVSRALSAPFRQLAVAAAALGRGRFDLELPRTRIPEARAIAQALRTSAGQLEDRLRRERDFAEHASHLLRTPLTGLRLELEDLTLRDDVPDDARAAATRGLGSVDEVNTVAGRLVQLSRGTTLVEGAELPLVDLATQLAQRWADRLAACDRALSASAEGDLTLTYTPGPVEHVLDLVLAEVVRCGSGDVRLDFEGQDGGHLEVRVCAQGPAVPVRGRAPEPHLERARTAVEALGGRIRGVDPATGLGVLLPRR
jgi:signal transduction histidine kinase